MNKNELDYAKKFPILFSQVREDPRIDIEIINTLPHKAAKVLMIASGGCTLAALARNPHVSEINAIDANPAQIDLCKLKLFLLNEPSKTRAEILGHLPCPTRQTKLAEIYSSLGLNSENFGDSTAVNLYGPDYVGRYEWLFRAFSGAFKQTQLGRQLPHIRSIHEQKELLQQDLSEIRELFDFIFSLETLIELFGLEAVQNRKTTYSDHFYHRFMWTLSHQLIHSNPFFYQFAYLAYPKSEQTYFLSCPSGTPCPVQFHATPMLEYLASQKSATYDYVHLSNILDWLDIDSVNQILNESSRVLKRGGKLSIRQLNSTIEIKDTLGLSFKTYNCVQDLSFFYPKIYIGEKQ